MKRILFFLITAITLSSCSEYMKLLKSSDAELKFNKAKEFYEEGSYDKAIPLCEDVIGAFRGTKRHEEVYFIYASSYYELGDYFFAENYYRQFVKTFPRSKYAEECAFKAALCSYQLSPKYSLDQSYTFKAIDNLQLFIEAYPESSKRDTCNKLMTQLNQKLELKSYENSKLYFKTLHYESAVISLNNTLKDFPNSAYEEDIRFLILKSSYELAINSVVKKKKERLEATVEAYQKYIDKFADSNRAGQAENLYENTIKELERL
ncbi:outer membrane protein assembly factor BamD [Luteibaculum oceani]|uniref:Outer membrane protein assembly factor BamD n=1 Tax=Luteibaculum oceani TaxID=1294296 RepID=A0A5C6US47_9FLAO|nr:outer membrane protein assembly factor BamD [Luteibaculum oceani]TXC76153.1 outer membrane protein assembly factor BamD [Luteibaculum oceani]